MKSRTHQLSAGRGTYVLLGAVVLVSLFPLYWSVVAASNDQAGISKSPPTLIPGTTCWTTCAACWTWSTCARRWSTRSWCPRR